MLLEASISMLMLMVSMWAAAIWASFKNEGPADIVSMEHYHQHKKAA
ncbi:MAG: hypothetical protein NPIRA02_39020 [Nitrospirales bacterium]|nr:MAG: hypothetical protein NPIRA02_39020 [Nitrospirales bacterium]